MKGATVLYQWNAETSVEIHLELGAKFDVSEDGHLRIWAEDAHLCAAYAPGTWRAVVDSSTLPEKWNKSKSEEDS